MYPEDNERKTITVFYMNVWTDENPEWKAIGQNCEVTETWVPIYVRIKWAWRRIKRKVIKVFVWR